MTMGLRRSLELLSTRRRSWTVTIRSAAFVKAFDMAVLGLLAAIALGAAGRQSAEPVLWLTPTGNVLLRGKPAKFRVTKGASPVETPFGVGLDLDGTHGGLLLADGPALTLSDSLSISTWIYLRAYVKAGPGAQVLFRGDDRPGLDPYQLVIHGDGTIVFAIVDPKNEVDQVSASIPLKKWVHVLGSFDSEAGEMKLWIDGHATMTIPTAHQPMRTLSKGDAPGVSVGNIQNDKGPHNQPLDGIVADLRLYDSAVKPAAAGYRPFKG